MIVDRARGGELITRFPGDWPRDIMNVAIIPK